jgi:uncharacterized protein YukE
MLDAPLNAHPDDAHRQAAALRQVAEIVGSLTHRMDARVESLHYEGPGADRFRSAMAERSQRAHRVSHQLGELADHLSARAHS